MALSLIEGFQSALAAVERCNTDYSFGKPDEKDFVIVILDAYGFVGAEQPPSHQIEIWATTIYEDHGEMIFTPEILVTFVYGAANAYWQSFAYLREKEAAEREPVWELDVCLDGGFPSEVDRSYDAVEECIEAVGVAMEYAEKNPDGVVTLLLTKRA